MIYQIELRFYANNTELMQTYKVIQKDSTLNAQYASNLKPVDVWEEQNTIIIHKLIPANISSQNAYNDYSPRIYPKESEDYRRVIKRVSEYSKALEK